MYPGIGRAVIGFYHSLDLYGMTADFYIIYECTLYFFGENADIFHRQPEKYYMPHDGRREQIYAG